MRLSEYLEETGESQKAFGQRIGVTQSAVAQMLAKRVGHDMVLTVCAATGWRVRPFDERRDLYPHPDDGMPKAGPVEPTRAAA